jgi:large subunit ribosomal protein L15
MKLVDLRPAEGATHRPKRVGRGVGSGHGKTCGRGTKGDKSRGSTKPGFEGGQTPLHRRLPQRKGFINEFKKSFAVVNVGRLDEFEAGTEITPELLKDRKVVKAVRDGVRVLGEGEITKALKVSAHHFSKAAEEKIKAAGASVEVLKC